MAGAVVTSITNDGWNMEKNQVTVLFFANLKDKAGTARIEVSVEPKSTVGDLKRLLVECLPGLGSSMENVLASVNKQFAFVEDELPVGAEVAFFPPVSGGSDLPTIVKVISGPLNLDELVQQITLTSTGAVCTFTGIVRGVTQRGDAHETTSLEYEAYAPMAEAKMAQIADEIRRRWQAIEGIVMVQRIGLLEPKTPTVIVACSAAHRDTGVFDAARYGIDRLKEIVPVWKKEIGPGGETWVEGDYHPGRSD